MMSSQSQSGRARDVFVYHPVHDTTRSTTIYRENADGQEYRRDGTHRGLEGHRHRATHVRRDFRHHLIPMQTSLGRTSTPATMILRRRTACRLHQIHHREILNHEHGDVAEALIFRNVSHDRISPGW